MSSSGVDWFLLSFDSFFNILAALFSHNEKQIISNEIVSLFKFKNVKIFKLWKRDVKTSLSEFYPLKEKTKKTVRRTDIFV